MTISYFCHDAKGKGGRDDAVLSSAYPIPFTDQRAK